MRPCKHAAQRAVEVLHRCCLGARPTVEMIWQSETSASAPHSLHDFFCIGVLLPPLEQPEKFCEPVYRVAVEVVGRTGNGNSRGALPHTPPTFRLK